jgi:hypothetical protein
MADVLVWGSLLSRTNCSTHLPKFFAILPLPYLPRRTQSARRRFDAMHVTSELRKPALSVAQGTTEAATAHIRVVKEQLRVVNQKRHASKHTSSLSSWRVACTSRSGSA